MSINGKEIYKIYAPIGAKWIEWVRPVPFVAIDTYNRKPNINWIDREAVALSQYEKNTAIFVDLPGKDSIEFGISLANVGYRPIPIFNGTDEQLGTSAILNTNIIENHLINGAEKLKEISVSKEANPAFLLDSFRTNRYRERTAIFDNSWDLYKQDIPTAEHFIKNGINKIIIVGEKVQSDLKKIFLPFQNAGINFYLTDGYTPVKKIVLKKTIKELFEKEEL